MRRTPANLILPLCLTALVCLRCGGAGGGEGAYSGPLPSAPDYSEPSQWFVSGRGSGADLFYIVSTETLDYISDGASYHHSDTYSDSLRALLRGEMLGVDRLLGADFNYFSPYYRQCTLESFSDIDTMEQRLPVAGGDVQRAFDYYIRHLNGGRPFILAGFSQGAMILLDILENMDDETYSRMIAAYAVGVAVSPERLEGGRGRIVPAGGADDTGVTVCYNSVRDEEGALWLFSGSALAINPVNWKTDGTPATLEYAGDTLSVHLDRESGLLFVDGYTGGDYILPLIGVEGNYHAMEIRFYDRLLRENMALRTSTFLSAGSGRP